MPETRQKGGSMNLKKLRKMTGWLLILCLLMGCASGMPSPAGQDASGTETEAVPGSDPADGSSAAPSGEGTASGETSDEEESAEEEYWSRAMAKRSQEYEPGSGELTAAEGFEAAPKRDYTLMIYMIGSKARPARRPRTSRRSQRPALIMQRPT